MRFSPILRSCFLAVAVCLCVQGQAPPAGDAQTEAKGLPPRATPGDYQFHVQAGSVTIAAEFKGHSIPTAQGPLTSEDYVAIEVGLFGAPGARLTLSPDDFSVVINRKKSPLPAQPFVLVAGSLKDPEWEPPESAESKKSKTKLGGIGQGESSGPPETPKIPIEVRRAMAQRVRKTILPEGDRPLPQAGLIFFQYRGKAENIRSLELVYSGPAGKTALKLQP